MKENLLCTTYAYADIRERIAAVNPELAGLMDELSPGPEYKLYLVRYPYGSMIIDKGVFQLPNAEQQLVPLTAESISPSVQEDLLYNGIMPVGLVLKNTIESFVSTRDRVIPAALFKPGKLMGLWRFMDRGKSYQEGNFWNLSSGARTICMLPKITDKNGYRRLKSKFKLTLPVPCTLSDHWAIFSHLANQKNFTTPWCSEILLFSKAWFSHQQDKEWQDFYFYLFNIIWQSSAFMRNQTIFDFLFSLIQENKNLKPNPYLADTVKYLIAIANGSTPAFLPAMDDSLAPIVGLQKVFLEDYGLKKYAPIIMHPHHLSAKEQRPVYYSLQMPTTMIFSPRSNRASSTMMELHELKYIMEIVLSSIQNGKLGLENTPLFELAKHIQYGFYHSDKDKFCEISPITDIATRDPVFVRSLVDDTTYVFPEFGPFFRGCVAISRQ